MSTKTRLSLGACLIAVWLPVGGCIAVPSKASPVHVLYNPPTQPVRTVHLNDRAQPLRKPRSPVRAAPKSVQFMHRAETASMMPVRSMTPDMMARRVSMTTPAPRVNPSPGTGRAVSPVGLFGEQVGGMAATVSSYDGSINLSPMSFATEGTCFDPDVDRLSESSSQLAVVGFRYPLGKLLGQTMVRREKVG